VLVATLGIHAANGEAPPTDPVPTYDAAGAALADAQMQFDAQVALEKQAQEEAAKVEAARVAQEQARIDQERLRRQRAAVQARSNVRAASASPPVVSVDTGADCLVHMAPKERKSVAEAHRCWDGLLASYSWSVATAFNKMYCESGGNPWAIGPRTKYGTAQGLMQILPGGSFDPATNMAQAWKKYEGAGHSWSPWTC
jgi:hypothetical protein